MNLVSQCRNLLRACILLAVATLMAAPLSAQTVRGDPESLAWLSGVHLDMQPFDQSARMGGLQEPAIKTLVQQRLQATGIMPLTRAECDSLDDCGVLHLRIRTVQAMGRWAYSIDLSLSQQVCSEKSWCGEAATWSAHGVYLASSGLQTNVGRQLTALLDLFVDDFRSVNP
jgi:hypothetical protein